MAGRYRALLIGNSTYPADEHNLQTLKGPVKDIAVLNRALVDRDTGLFADTDVALLPEASSTRAVRALGAFFAGADRDDVLLLYFSGHGKLDQLGRLHLCMQDTESTDLLSTAVSSVRINEFADASRARNVVIVLDCCYAGAFRGTDLAEPVAGPGRYVMSSCRGTQLANDATVDNGTSFFTQHLVEALSGATDYDHDGYVSFSDVYGYVDRRLREDGKQIPQRRVSGDGDVRLARRPPDVAPRPESSEGAAGAPPAVVPPPRVSVPDPGSAPPGPPKPVLQPSGRRHRWSRRRVAVTAGVAAVVLAGGVLAAVLVWGGSPSGSSSPGPLTPGTGSYTATAPWRLRLDGTAFGYGCTLALTDASGATVLKVVDVYSVRQDQVHQTGTLRWTTRDQRCFATALPGSGTATLPFVQEGGADTDAFALPARGVTVSVTAAQNTPCDLRLFDQATGDELATALDVNLDSPVRTLDGGGRSTGYLFTDNCTVRVTAAS